MGSPPPFVDEHAMSAFLDGILTKAKEILGSDVPPRSFVAAGVPVMDCGQLTVHAEKFRPSQQLTRSQQAPTGTKEIVTVCDVVVTLFRCVTSLTQEAEIPDAVTLDTEGKAQADVGFKLWFGLLAATLDGSLFPAQFRPTVLWRDGVQINPASGLSGWKMTAEVTLS